MRKPAGKVAEDIPLSHSSCGFVIFVVLTYLLLITGVVLLNTAADPAMCPSDATLPRRSHRAPNRQFLYTAGRPFPEALDKLLGAEVPRPDQCHRCTDGHMGLYVSPSQLCDLHDDTLTHCSIPEYKALAEPNQHVKTCLMEATALSVLAERRSNLTFCFENLPLCHALK